MNSSSSATRKSNYELLKIIALIMIIISHTLPFCGDGNSAGYIDLNRATTQASVLILVFFKYLGQIGNTVFIICSAYFLTESKSFKVNKVLYIIFDSFIISVTVLIIFLCCGFTFSVGRILSQIFPICTQQCWFIPCYIFLYVLHPALNRIIEFLNGKLLLLFSLLIFIINIMYGTGLMKFIAVYFFTALFKRDFKFNSSVPKNILTLLSASSILIASIILLNCLGLTYTTFSNSLLELNEMTNPAIFLISISLFNLFGKLNVKSRFTNYVSSTSMLIYLIHENRLIRGILKPKLFSLIYNSFSYEYIDLWCLALAMIIFIISFAIAALYKQTVGFMGRKIIDKIILKLKSKNGCP